MSLAVDRAVLLLVHRLLEEMDESNLSEDEEGQMMKQ